MRKDHFDVTGMSCAACSARVEKSVAKLPGIKEVSVNLLKNSMTVEYDEAALTSEGIVEAVVIGGNRRGGREGRVRRFAARGEGERRAEGESRAVARGYSETGI